MEAEIQVRNCDVPLLKCCLERLLQLFECLAKVEEGVDCLQLKLWTHKTDDTLRSAQEFLLSVTSENPASEKRQPLSTEALNQLFNLRSEIERDARVLLIFTDGEVAIRGPQANVQLAMQLVDEFLAHGVVLSDVLKHSLTADSLLSEPMGGSNGRENGRLTRRVESEDSSYDSDNESGLGPGTKSQGGNFQQKMHDDVSRTVSDTLGAEFAEYVNSNKVELKTVLADPSYQTRLEFAVKLGYTEAQFQNALQRLGLSASNNELLAELIKLTSTAKPVSLDASTSDAARSGELYPIVIDGPNVAMSHGKKDVFSCRGIKICVDYFRARGHKQITVFVPSWRREPPRPNTPISDQEILFQLESENIVKFTPSRNVNGKRIVCYEDYYVLDVALKDDAIVVSNDNYRDLVQRKPEFKKVVEERLLMYVFVNDHFMPPEDPLGRTGPTLDEFLSKVRLQLPSVCPYAKKCTYGNKCKYYHPERGNKPQKSITEKLAEQAKIQLQEVKARANLGNEVTRTRSVPGTLAGDSALPTGTKKKQPLGRTRSAAPAQRLQDDFPIPGSAFGGGDVLWRHQSWSNLPKNMLSESGHLSLAKKLSDPDSHCETVATDPSPGLHKKLQRQLTLNPNHDDRLEQMKLVNTHSRSPNAHHTVTHLSSDGFRSNQTDAFRDGWQAGGLSNQNSTSDTKLNMFPNQFVTPTSYQANIWSPLPSQHNVRYPIPSQQHVRPSSVPPQNRMRAPLSVPHAPSGNFGSGGPLPGVNTFDERHKLFNRLTSIFPEEQVKAAMESLPDELNPQKICAAIISMFPPRP
ncbi:endoribonuclease ZC3H12A [Galendromus occidentalis]|uniref:Endoribonuclease ZC3H12A n=1 Tax=Galendromus occidentalis TaxID=34638 RepID=A0AAJ7L5U6_9ACAR|nr:endoribonuclease ZC3H12A [Galendromus occidentalis]